MCLNVGQMLEKSLLLEDVKIRTSSTLFCKILHGIRKKFFNFAPKCKYGKMDIVFLLGGLVLILLGANYLTDGASSLAKKLKVSDLVIGLTVVAFGTSAPELAVSVSSALKCRSTMTKPYFNLGRRKVMAR